MTMNDKTATQDHIALYKFLVRHCFINAILYMLLMCKKWTLKSQNNWAKVILGQQ